MAKVSPVPGTTVRAAMKVVFGIAVLAAPASAGPCAPTGTLPGEPDAVARIGDELHRLGVATTAPATGCAAVRADVKRDEHGLAIAIGSEGRVGGDPPGAAAWV